MRKLITGLIFFSLLPCMAAFADTLRLGGFVGWFSARDAVLKEVYTGRDMTYGARLSLRIWGGLSAAVSGAQYRQNGTTTLLKDETRITINPLTASLRYTIPLGRINPYLGGGYCYVFYKEESLIGGSRGEGSGYSLEAGLDVGISSLIHLDLGVTWNDVRVTPTPEAEVQLGGLQATAGLQLAF